MRQSPKSGCAVWGSSLPGGNGFQCVPMTHLVFEDHLNHFYLIHYILYFLEKGPCDEQAKRIEKALSNVSNVIKLVRTRLSIH
jgi:hypothetical protein